MGSAEALVALKGKFRETAEENLLETILFAQEVRMTGYTVIELPPGEQPTKELWTGVFGCEIFGVGTKGEEDDARNVWVVYDPHTVEKITIQARSTDDDIPLGAELRSHRSRLYGRQDPKSYYYHIATDTTTVMVHVKNAPLGSH